MIKQLIIQLLIIFSYGLVLFVKQHTNVYENKYEVNTDTWVIKKSFSPFMIVIHVFFFELLRCNFFVPLGTLLKPEASQTLGSLKCTLVQIFRIHIFLKNLIYLSAQNCKSSSFDSCCLYNQRVKSTFY